MLKLTAILATCCVSALGASTHPATADGNLPSIETFDAKQHLCGNDEQPLTGFLQVIALNEFLKDVRHGAEVISPTECSPNRIQAMMLITQSANNIEMAASAKSFVTFWIGRSSKLETFEARYANDAEMLIYMGLLCDVLRQDRASCFRALASSTPERFRAESPVFCDFATAEQRNPAADGAVPDIGMLRELPGICGALLDDADTETAVAVEAWQTRVDRQLFPRMANLRGG